MRTLIMLLLMVAAGNAQADMVTVGAEAKHGDRRTIQLAAGPGLMGGGFDGARFGYAVVGGAVIPGPGKIPTATLTAGPAGVISGSKAGSISRGLPYEGTLANGTMLPITGVGYRSIRAERKRNYGTDEMVNGIIWIARKLRMEDSRTPPMALGDISAPGGGEVSHHRSHQSGRDVDIVFFWTDAKGEPIPAEEFVSFDGEGRGSYGGRAIRFDAERNLDLVMALLENPYFGKDVSYIFVSDAIKRLVLRRAREEGVSTGRASEVMSQPTSPHNNHFHVRIRCSAEDRKVGCRD